MTHFEMTRRILLLWRGGENFKEIFDGVVFNTTILLARLQRHPFVQRSGTKDTAESGKKLLKNTINKNE